MLLEDSELTACAAFDLPYRAIECGTTSRLQNDASGLTGAAYRANILRKAVAANGATRITIRGQKGPPSDKVKHVNKQNLNGLAEFVLYFSVFPSGWLSAFRQHPRDINILDSSSAHALGAGWHHSPNTNQVVRFMMCIGGMSCDL